MKHLLTEAAGSKRQPVTNATFDHIQEAYKEALEALSKAMIKEDTEPWILYGCAASIVFLGGGGSEFEIEAGAIYYQGEIYLVDAQTGGNLVSVASGEVPVGTITTTYIGTDPITFSDGTTGNVHQIKKIVFESGLSGSSDFDFDDVKRYSDTITFNDIKSQNFRLRYESGGSQVWEASDTRTWQGGSYMKATKQGRIIILDINLIAEFNAGSPNNLSVAMSGLGFNLPSWAQPASSAIIQRTCEVDNDGSSTWRQPEGSMEMRLFTADGDANAPDFQVLISALRFNGGTAAQTAGRVVKYANYDYSSNSTGTLLSSGVDNFILSIRGQFIYEAANDLMPSPY